MNKIRERLARAIEAQGGYHSSRDGSFALEYCVGLYHTSNDIGELLAIAKSLTSDPDFELFREPDDDDMDRLYTLAQETLCEGLHDGDNDSWRQYPRDVAIRHGISYSSWSKKFSIGKDGKVTYFAQTFPGTFEAAYGLYGRSGKHLCIESFEGHSLEIFNDELVERLRDDESCRYHGYTNQWCRKLLAAMEVWEEDFTPRKASEAMDEQMAWEMYSWSEWEEGDAARHALVPL